MPARIMTENSRARRHRRLRTHLTGTAERPRLVVFRSSRYVWVQLIDDLKGTTLAAVTDHGQKLTGPKVARAHGVGKQIAEQATQRNITRVVFDRGGYRYHGRVKAVAEGAREAGLTI
ncbi:50S ribosomal protein L18 [Candidatus Berkelbacteria bacterium]|nr:50S ribosomal protein L18 [Candidatus Berkelbacteria bacterium]